MAEAIKKSGAEIAVETIGGYQYLDVCEDVIASGKADFIAGARACRLITFCISCTSRARWTIFPSLCTFSSRLSVVIVNPHYLFDYLNKRRTSLFT